MRRYRKVEDETWAQWQADRAAGAEWTRTIKNWTRYRKGDVRIVFEGLFSEPDEQGEQQQISIYYFLLGQYQPAMGPPSQQAEDGPIGIDELRHTVFASGSGACRWDSFCTPAPGCATRRDEASRSPPPCWLCAPPHAGRSPASGRPPNSRSSSTGWSVGSPPSCSASWESALSWPVRSSPPGPITDASVPRLLSPSSAVPRPSKPRRGRSPGTD